jgi:hypothetical protein
MDAPTRRQLVDTVMDHYVSWRERSASVGLAYTRFREAAPAERGLAHAAYLAALDQEELAAADYRAALEQAIATFNDEPRVALAG